MSKINWDPIKLDRKDTGLLPGDQVRRRHWARWGVWVLSQVWRSERHPVRAWTSERSCEYASAPTPALSAASLLLLFAKSLNIRSSEVIHWSLGCLAKGEGSVNRRREWLHVFSICIIVSLEISLSFLAFIENWSKHSQKLHLCDCNSMTTGCSTGLMIVVNLIGKHQIENSKERRRRRKFVEKYL